MTLFHKLPQKRHRFIFEYNLNQKRTDLNHFGTRNPE